MYSMRGKTVWTKVVREGSQDQLNPGKAPSLLGWELRLELMGGIGEGQQRQNLRAEINTGCGEECS